MDCLDRVLDFIAHNVLGILAAFLLWVLMLLTFLDVVGRDLLNAPLSGAYEVSELVMGALIFAALPAVTRLREHVAIDLFDRFFSPGMAQIRDLLNAVIGFLVLAAVAWQCWILGLSLQEYAEVTPHLRIPVYPIVFLISVMSGLSATLFLLAGLRRAQTAERGSE